MKAALTVLVSSLALLLLAACGGDGTASPTAEPTRASPTPAPTIGRSPTPAETPSPAETLPPGQTPVPPNVCLPNPDPATPNVLVIDQPLPLQTVTSPITVSGRIAAFEARFMITIYRADGSAIADAAGMSAEGQTLSPFSESVPFSVAGLTPACLWVYEASARDGSPIHVGQVPLLLSP